jgi:hypothetical protein
VCFYNNHARRLRLEKLFYPELLAAPAASGYFKPLQGPGGRFTFETAAHRFVSEVKRPLRSRFGSETVKNLQQLYATAIVHTQTGKSARSGVNSK